MFVMNTNVPHFLWWLKNIAIFIRTKNFVKSNYYLCPSSTEMLVLLCWTPLSKFEFQWDMGSNSATMFGLSISAFLPGFIIVTPPYKHPITLRFDKSVLHFFFVYSSIFFRFLCLSPPLIFKFKPIWHANFLSFNFFHKFPAFHFLSMWERYMWNDVDCFIIKWIDLVNLRGKKRVKVVKSKIERWKYRVYKVLVLW